MSRTSIVTFLCLSLTTACAVVPHGDDSLEGSLSVLTLNLHTYQELSTEGTAEANLTDDQAAARVAAYGEIFDRIAAGIRDLDPDLICLQEVGEWAGTRRGDPASIRFGASDSNMALQIRKRLDARYFVAMDWSHFGYAVWLEGSAILSKYPIIATESRYISRPENSHVHTWKSRNIPMATVRSDGGEIDVYTVHAGWWDDAEEPFQEQFSRLMAWIDENSVQATTTILCGDFNVAAGSAGYRMMTENTGFSDPFALANPDKFLQPTIGAAIDGWEGSADPQRIDYVLINEGSPWRVVDARVVFTAADYGAVSDHAGVFMRFAPKSD